MHAWRTCVRPSWRSAAALHRQSWAVESIVVIPFGREVTSMRGQPTLSRLPAGPALIRSRVVGLLGAGLGAIACGSRSDLNGVPPTTGTPTATPRDDAGSAGSSGRARSDAGSSDSGEDATFSPDADSGFKMGVFDATGRHAADALAEAASDGHIFNPPCGVPPPHKRP
jgi:hypothetical protein